MAQYCDKQFLSCFSVKFSLNFLTLSAFNALVFIKVVHRSVKGQTVSPEISSKC